MRQAGERQAVNESQASGQSALKKIEGLTLTEEEVGEGLGVSRNTIAALRRGNQIGYRKITRIKVMYHIDDVVGFLAHRRVKAKWEHE